MERNIRRRLKEIIGNLNLIKEESDDPSTKVGCILVDKYGEIVVMGYNKKPDKWLNTVKFPWEQREDKYKYVIHAEMSAVMNLRSIELCPKVHAAVVSLFPCSNCTKLLIEAGISELYYQDIRVNEESAYAMSLLNLCGVKVYKL